MPSRVKCQTVRHHVLMRHPDRENYALLFRHNWVDLFGQGR